MDTPTLTPEASLSWKAPRAVTHERSTQWYLVGGVCVIGVTVYAVLMGVWSLAIVCLLCGALYFLVRDHQFPDVPCTLTDKGVQIDETFLPWPDVKGYWFAASSVATALHFVPRSARKPDLVIQTGAILPNDIRLFLAGKTDELTDKQESLLDILAHLTKL